jgi:hypothetical protein
MRAVEVLACERSEIQQRSERCGHCTYEEHQRVCVPAISKSLHDACYSYRDTYQYYPQLWTRGQQRELLARHDLRHWCPLCGHFPVV